MIILSYFLINMSDKTPNAKKKTVFIAHPVRGDIGGNMEKIINICKEIHNQNVIPIAPYLVSLQYLDDNIPNERFLGIEANLELFHRGYIDELWLFGDRISKGMEREILLAIELNIPIVPKTEEVKKDFEKFSS